jgi:hypothetical protein
VVTGTVDHLWIYLLGPVLGACLAVAFTRFIHGHTEADREAADAAQGQG